MAINEAYNVDCIEYMRSLPDKYFDLAVCDPPFGKGNDDTLYNGGKVWRKIQPLIQALYIHFHQEAERILIIKQSNKQIDYEPFD